ncbi:MAG TPA: flavin reductase [Polyangia bacterium]|nr:flavin reductase [Polyangia bacterium]
MARRLAQQAAHRATLGVRTIPQFAIVDLPAPQRQIEVALQGSFGAVDVTSRTVAVSLDPLRIAVGLPKRADALPPPAVATLTFRETTDGRAEVGRLDLRLHESIALPDAELAVFRPVRGRDACINPLRRSLYYAWKRWTRRQRPGPEPDFADFTNLLIHYICPRPVALVTVMDDDARGNLFPMDLLAQVGSQSFVAALKNSNRAMEQVCRSRRFVVSRIPFELATAAYALADMHRAENIDWETVPFALARSERFGYPIPAAALTTTEVEIHRTENLGSHTALIGVAVHEQRLNEGRGMHHVSGLYEDHCRARGRALVTPR